MERKNDIASFRSRRETPLSENKRKYSMENDRIPRTALNGADHCGSVAKVEEYSPRLQLLQWADCIPGYDLPS
jgi:hypothetical protein